MRVLVLEEATTDLVDGYRFYERQADGLGEYFLDSLCLCVQIFSHYDFLAAFTLSTMAIIVFLRSDFLMLFTIAWRMVLLSSELFSTVVVTPRG